MTTVPAHAQQLQAEVERNASGLAFRAGEGRYVSGALAAIEFVARRHQDGGADLLFRIVPYSLREDLPDSVTRAAEEAFRQQLEHADERVRALAARQLARLHGPRLASDDLAGLRLELEVTLGSHARRLVQMTDSRGCAVFSGIALASECHVVAARFGADPVEPADTQDVAERIEKNG